MKSGFLNKSDCTRIEKGFAKNVNQGGKGRNYRDGGWGFDIEVHVRS